MANNTNNKVSTKVFALGGLHEVGKNMYVVEHGDEIMIMDAGVKFGDDMPGVDAIIQDVTYLIENQQKIKSLVITHGHEDHIGGVTHLLKAVQVPTIYAPRLALGLIRKKISESKIANANLVEYDSTTVIKSKEMEISFFTTTHSIPDSYGVAIRTVNGLIVNTGDFKFDMTPIGQKSDFAKMADLGKEGVTLLLSDSTNSEVDGYTLSETVVRSEIEQIFREAKGRLIIATFASNVNRVRHIIESAVHFKRKVATYGRSMDKVIDMSRKMGHLHVPDKQFVKNKEVASVADEELLILCTGSQGEPLAALSRISRGEHQDIKAKPGDTIVFSSSPIPGNAIAIKEVVNNLVKTGATVIINSSEGVIHTSGHASKGEQQLMLALMTPKYFMPVHGDFRMLKIHGQTGVEMGVAEDNVFVCSNGDVVEVLNGECKLGERVEAGAVYLDSTSGMVSSRVMSDRVILAEDGFVSVIISIDANENKLLAKPQIISRGFVYMKESGELIMEMQARAERVIKKEFEGKTSFGKIKQAIINELGPFIYKKLNRNPIIAPVIMNKN